MAGVEIEHRIIERDAKRLKVVALLGPHIVNFVRHANWQTDAYWGMPADYNLETFFDVSQAVYLEAVKRGLAQNDQPTFVLQSHTAEGNPRDILCGPYNRPLTVPDLSVLEASEDQVDHLQLKSNLGTATFYQREGKQNGVRLSFNHWPSQVRAAAYYIATLSPPELTLDTPMMTEFINQLPHSAVG